MLFLCWLLLLIQKLWVHSTYIEFFEDWSPERGKVWKTRLWFWNVLDENAAMLALLAHRDVPTFSHQNMVYECLWCMKLSLKIRYLQTPEFFSTLKLLMHALNLSKKPMAKQPGFGVWSLNLWSLQLSHHLSIFLCSFNHLSVSTSSHWTRHHFWFKTCAKINMAQINNQFTLSSRIKA